MANPPPSGREANKSNPQGRILSARIPHKFTTKQKGAIAVAYKDNILSAEKEIRSFLSSQAKNIKITLVESTASTNDDMKAAARSGEEEISVLIAESQSAGRGSKGRSFFSPAKTGIYMSVLLRPDCSAEEGTLLTPMAAVAAAEAIEKVTGTETKIKWVNDIFIGGRKAAGILTEGAAEKGGHRLSWAVIGIGINLSPPKGGFPEGIKDIAGAVTADGENSRNRLIAEIINSLVYYYKKLSDREFYAPYRQRLFILSQQVTVTDYNGSYEATVLDIDENFRLKVRLGNGSERILSSAEVSLKF